jgi:metallo-beta-lactamase superfamily protein
VHSIAIGGPASLSGTFPGGDWSIGPALMDGVDRLRTTLRVTRADGLVLAQLPMKAREGTRGARGVEIFLDDASGALTLTLTVDLANSSMRLHYAYSHTGGVLPASLLPTLEFLRNLRASHQLQIFDGNIPLGPLDRWVVLPLLRAMGTRRGSALLDRSSLAVVARAVEPGSAVPGLPDWQCIATPGHTPGHVSYFRPEDRVLISGDALVAIKINSLIGLPTRRAGVSGPPWYTTFSRAAARESISTLARLGPTVLAGGHGNPMTGTRAASALAALAAER